MSRGGVSCPDDDLNNTWGTQLVPTEYFEEYASQWKKQESQPSIGEAVKDIFHPFHYCRHLQNGSDANMHAIVIATRFSQSAQ